MFNLIVFDTIESSNSLLNSISKVSSANPAHQIVKNGNECRFEFIKINGHKLSFMVQSANDFDQKLIEKADAIVIIVYENDRKTMEEGRKIRERCISAQKAFIPILLLNRPNPEPTTQPSATIAITNNSNTWNSSRNLQQNNNTTHNSSSRKCNSQSSIPTVTEKPQKVLQKSISSLAPSTTVSGTDASQQCGDGGDSCSIYDLARIWHCICRESRVPNGTTACDTASTWLHSSDSSAIEQFVEQIREYQKTVKKQHECVLI